MKGSPLISTAITIIVLLGLYFGMRSIILPEEEAKTGSHAGHDHSHATPSADHSDHDDRALETEIELYFSSLPKSVKITQPSTQKEVLTATEFDSPEWLGTGVLNLEGHFVELQVEVEWQTPNDMNFVQIIVHPANHASREKTLRSDDNISDIADFAW